MWVEGVRSCERLPVRCDRCPVQVSAMKVAPEKMVDLYEQVVKEMIELREVDTARMLLRSTVPMAMLKQEDPDR